MCTLELALGGSRLTRSNHCSQELLRFLRICVQSNGKITWYMYMSLLLKERCRIGKKQKSWRPHWDLMRSRNQASESTQLRVTRVFFLSLLSRNFEHQLSSSFHRFVILCRCWDTPSEKTGLWQQHVPIMSSVSKVKCKSRKSKCSFGEIVLKC